MLATLEAGPADRPTVLLLHGGGASGWTWRPVVERLRGYHALVPDLPEHGRSLELGPFTMPDAARQVAELIRERAHGGQAHVVGLSLGAQVAVQLLASAPGRVASLMVTGTALRPAPVTALLRHPIGRRWTTALLKAYWPWRLRPWLLRANMRGFGIPDACYAEFAEDTRAMTVEAFWRIVFEESQGYALPPGLDGVQVPALVLAGEHEEASVIRSAADLVAALPRASGGLVPGAGHNWPIETPDRFAEVLTAWLAQRALPSGLRPLP